MSHPKYSIGIDFGTESGRAVLVEVSTGREVATSVYLFKNGVIDEFLPVDGTPVRLEPEWALQDPEDYLRTLKITIPEVLDEGKVDPAEVIGIGIDFTACTMLPVKKDGMPLCTLPEFRRNPHAWVKLWKHHAAQPEADQINETARQMGEKWLDRYGGKTSSEWFFAKTTQILHEAPEVYLAADRLMEAGDWVVWQLTGIESRNNCAAGYKALWSKREGFPDKKYFTALDPRLENVIDEKMMRTISPIGHRAGNLTAQAAGWMGLKPGTAVAVANVDAHVSVPAATVVEAGRMVMIMGTSICHMVLSEVERVIPGICGYVEDGILPGYFGYEAGQSCVGDHFAWLVENCVPADYVKIAEAKGINQHAYLEEKAANLKPGESGLLALDWWNGNRSILVDANLSGMLLGTTLATKPEDIYRALIEATAYGTRLIIETFEQNGISITELVACGGLPEKNKLLMQIFSDVTGREIKISASQQTSALGSAMYGAVAAGKAGGGYDSICEAAQYMARLKDEVYKPIPGNKLIFDQLFMEYLRLHDYFGRGENNVMKILKHIRDEVRGVG